MTVELEVLKGNADLLVNNKENELVITKNISTR